MSEFDSAHFLKNTPALPGVYQMFAASGELLYVGKAKSLNKRLASYFRSSGLSLKTQSLMAQVANIETTVTNTEVEALLLESNLIKQHKPRYNILLRDDKSYAQIFLSDHPYPRITFHRGSRREKGRYFGPYPSSVAVRETLTMLQKVFRVRQCEDSYFSNRSRPCLQYQIKRCTAPCVGYVDKAHYAEDVAHTVAFLEGRSNALMDDLGNRMEQAAAALDFEQAAILRDQIIQLRKVTEKQFITSERGSVDVVAVASSGGVSCVLVFYVRDGRNLGKRSFFPRVESESSSEEVLAAFLAQYYLGHEIPSDIIISQSLEEQGLIAELLSQQAGKKISIVDNPRGERAQWLKLAQMNAEHALEGRLSSRSSLQDQLLDLQHSLGLEEIPSRIECFDISHTSGEDTVASCVVFGLEGAMKTEYRRYNISGITAADDYAAMRQALSRRFRRSGDEEQKLPDLLLIDGGKGQLGVAREVLQELQITQVDIVGVAKGEERKPGLETLFLNDDNTPIMLKASAPALHLIQQVRDEAHRFAITGMRKRRAKARAQTSLDAIPGIGAKRRQALIKHFGGIAGVKAASVHELSKVAGISDVQAQTIYDYLRSEG